MSDQIFVRSHIARDLLQSAGLFKNDRLVVWEYVSNGLQYIGPSTNPIVKVTLDTRRKAISIADNGRGMGWQDLENFFVMHGENLDRKEGRPGRGYFGTGKSAAFGIANVLRITTRRNGMKSKVELRRSDVERMTSEEPIPVTKLEKEIATIEPNGTLVEIEGVHLRSLDQAGIIHYIERHLAKWPKNSTVLVNNHECEFVEPPIAEEKTFLPDGQFKEVLGDAELVIKVSKAPLDEDLRGISVFSRGVWHETTLAGSEGREMSQYIFGEIEVPGLEDDKSPIPPFDVSRSMRLNPDNELVQAIHAFIGGKVELVRRRLCDAERKRKSEEDVQKLARQAEEIARVINEDFDSFRQRVAKTRAKAAGGGDVHNSQGHGGDTDEDLMSGHELSAEPVPRSEKEPGSIRSGDQGGEPPDLQLPVLPATPEAPRRGQPSGGADGRRKPKGGFRVEFDKMGTDSHRAVYVADVRTIYINLEHPQLVAAKGVGPTDDPIFKRLSYEVAFSEYAIALAQEMAAHDEFIDPTDPIVEIRETLNRVARKGAVLYAV